MTTTTALEIAREPERKRITGVSRVQWWRLEREGKVPKRVRLGPNSVGWIRRELYDHNAKLAAERDQLERIAELATTEVSESDEADADSDDGDDAENAEDEPP